MSCLFFLSRRYISSSLFCWYEKPAVATTHGNSPSIVTEDNIKLLFEIQNKVDGIKANYSGSAICLADICMNPMDKDCAIQSVLQYFKMDPVTYDDYGGLEHLWRVYQSGVEWRETELNSSPSILQFTSNWGIRFYVGSSQFQEFNFGFLRIWIPSIEVVIEFRVESSITNQNFLPKIPMYIPKTTSTFINHSPLYLFLSQHIPPHLCNLKHSSTER
ncbi:hypothetical protein DVH24_015761 [Malus domestica]|uniref:NPC1 middle luminal domain-containing protein n=1 Tax=Malus domestica TaxID=3750 RepID=A0A498HJQ1_MALDO|nr:hypothetical protein DVH24_015761 [Malus domestica]